jgi:ABC-type branched-subunit amino acid transport system ATPase component
MTLLEATGLSKRFGGLRAVEDMSFAVRPHEILGLIGPNGSGKSTTLSMVMGIVRADQGSIRLDGTEIRGWPTHRISRHGIGIAFQHSRPLHRQTVLEHVKLALLPDSLWQLAAARHVSERAVEIAEQVGLGEVLGRLPSTLPFADLRRLELAKAIARDPKVLLIDEPFAGLTTSEVQEFSRLISRLREEGRAIMLVDHNVKGVRALVDRALAMHAGRKIAEGSADEVMNDAKVRTVYLGGSLESIEKRAAEVRAPSSTLLDVAGLDVRYGKAQALDQVEISVREGEFVAVVGLNGAGKTTLFNAISGLVPYGGAIGWRGTSLAGRTPAAIARLGIVQCPESRELFGTMSVAENLELAGQRLARRDYDERLAFLYKLFPRLEERTRQLARTLSGGEQQMLTIARALVPDPKLLILDEPTLGLAPIVLQEISQAIETLRRETALTVLLGEQNVTFALRHADRVYVLENGRITWQGPPQSFASEMGERYL